MKLHSLAVFCVVLVLAVTISISSAQETSWAYTITNEPFATYANQFQFTVSNIPITSTTFTLDLTLTGLELNRNVAPKDQTNIALLEIITVATDTTGPTPTDISQSHLTEVPLEQDAKVAQIPVIFDVIAPFTTASHAIKVTFYTTKITAAPVLTSYTMTEDVTKDVYAAISTTFAFTDSLSESFDFDYDSVGEAPSEDDYKKYHREFELEFEKLSHELDLKHVDIYLSSSYTGTSSTMFIQYGEVKTCEVEVETKDDVKTKYVISPEVLLDGRLHFPGSTMAPVPEVVPVASEIKITCKGFRISIAEDLYDIDLNYLAVVTVTTPADAINVAQQTTVSFAASDNKRSFEYYDNKKKENSKSSTWIAFVIIILIIMAVIVIVYAIFKVVQRRKSHINRIESTGFNSTYEAS